VVDGTQATSAPYPQEQKTAEDTSREGEKRLQVVIAMWRWWTRHDCYRASPAVRPSQEESELEAQEW
jgi:hypothetical protein